MARKSSPKEKKTNPPHLRNNVLPHAVISAIRAAVGALLLRAHGRSLSATMGVFHGPRAGMIYGFVILLISLMITRMITWHVLKLQYQGSCVIYMLSILSYHARFLHCTAICTALASSISLFGIPLLFQLIVACIFGATLFASLSLSPENASHLHNALFVWCCVCAAHVTFETNSKKRENPYKEKLSSHKYSAPLSFLIASALARLVLPGTGAFIRTHVFQRPLPKGYKLMAQKISTTGRISVLDEDNRGIRFLISDHSILGGRYMDDGVIYESIFAPFYIHEAVRLARLPGERIDEIGGRNGKSLCIGLGVGVVAQALHDHGCQVDVVEYDEAVAKYAQKYFGVKGPKIHVQDGAAYLASAKLDSNLRYDYVVHDVFTGGAVHLTMFSMSTLRDIRAVMRDNGVLALNFVGLIDPQKGASRTISAVYARLSAIFQHVSAFGEKHTTSLHNVVFFASDIPERMQFRVPQIKDFLGDSTRHNTLREFEKMRLDNEKLSLMPLDLATDKQINAGQRISADEHWKAMRGILNESVWYALAASDAVEL